MYHIGQEKGQVLKDFLRQCIENHGKQSNKVCLNIAELGTYCGYSAILLAKSVRELAPSLDFHIYSTEVNPQNVQIATTMILMAKLQKYITVVLFEPSVQTLSGSLRKHVSSLDFLFLDHAKHMYLEDLMELEKHGLVRRGTHVAADNVVYNRLVEYRNHVRQLAKQSIVETRLAEMKLEYSEDIKDGIGKRLQNEHATVHCR